MKKTCRESVEEGITYKSETEPLTVCFLLLLNCRFQLFNFKPWIIYLWILKKATLQKVFTDRQSQIRTKPKPTVLGAVQMHEHCSWATELAVYIMEIIFAGNKQQKKGKEKRHKIGNWVLFSVWWWGLLTENKFCLFARCECHDCELYKE